MRIAVPFDGTGIPKFFGKAKMLKLYDVDGQTITHSEDINIQYKGHHSIEPYLKDHGIDLVVCGALGAGVRAVLTELGIKFVAGITGNPDAAISTFLAENPLYDNKGDISRS